MVSFYDFYDDFRRAHNDILLKEILYDGFFHDDEPYDKRPFKIRATDIREEISVGFDNCLEYLNSFERPIQINNDMIDKFKQLVYFPIDDMFDLAFEAGVHSGLVIALDLSIIKKPKGVDIYKKIRENKSILKYFMQEKSNN